MAIEKGLYAAPKGIEDLMDGENAMPELEIEIEDPEEVSLGIDGVEIQLRPEPETAEDFDANLADYMSDKELAQLVTDLVGDFDKARQNHLFIPNLNNCKMCDMTDKCKWYRKE